MSESTHRFADRHDAGTRLAGQLRHLAGRPDVVILALPRGGVPVAYEIARELRQPVDVFVVRKLGLPLHEELAMGAVASGGVRFLNRDVIDEFGVSPRDLDAVTRAELAEVRRREALYRGDRPLPALAGRTVVLVDDGIATGSTMASAIQAVRQLMPARVIVATPVIAEDTRRALLRSADEVVSLMAPERFFAVGMWYDDFTQTTDADVIALLNAVRRPGDGGAGAPPAPTRTLAIPAGPVTLAGDLVVPAGARGLVIFAHGSGSSRRSPRNREVAAALQRAGLATLLFDLLTTEEEGLDRITAQHRFDIPLLAGRLVAVTDWAAGRDDLGDLPIGYFGASTGAAAALVAAAARPEVVRAIVSRGGRPDLAGDALDRVQAPSLLVVGGADRDVLALNRGAQTRMHDAVVELSVVPGAGHLFEEPGALDSVVRIASEWFLHHLAGVPAGGA